MNLVGYRDEAMQEEKSSFLVCVCQHPSTIQSDTKGRSGRCMQGAALTTQAQGPVEVYNRFVQVKSGDAG